MKFRKTLKTLLILSLFTTSIMFLQKDVSADPVTQIYYGNGNGASGEPVQCSGFTYGHTSKCGVNGSEGGGGSWHIYKTNGSLEPEYNSGILWGTPKITATTIKQSLCKNTPWYMVYAWDGKNHSHVTGPLGHKVRTRNKGYEIEDNDYVDNGIGYKTYDKLQEAINNGTYEGKKVTIGVAEDIYNRATGKNLSKLDPQIGYFCIPPKTFVKTNTYYSQSNVRGKNSDMDDIMGQITQDEPTNMGSIRYTTPVSVNVGESTEIVFSHNVFAKYQQPDKNIAQQDTNWYMYRMLYTGDKKDDRNLVGQGGFRHDDILSLSGNEAIEWKGIISGFNSVVYTPNKLYAADNRPYTDEGGNPYLVRDHYVVTFKKEGVYTLCEQMHIQENEGFTTAACITINVGSYYSKSNVSNRNAYVSDGSAAESTGIKNYPETASTELEIETDGKANITFSHNIFSTIKSQNIPFRIERTMNGIPGYDNTDYDISTPSSTTNSSNQIESGYASSANFQNTVTENGTEYYIGEAETMYEDGGGYRYILRDFYEITFPHEGVFQFCETVYITDDQQEIEFTTACSTIYVGVSPDNPPPPNVSMCGNKDWEPATYKSSSSSKGTTSVIAAVKKSSWNSTGYIKNLNTEGSDVVWARPGDSIDWKHCYYPGVQSVANTTATYSHKSHSGSNNTNGNAKMSSSSFGLWKNYYSISGFNQLDRSTKKGQFFSLKPPFLFTIGDDSIKEFDDLKYIVPTGSLSVAGLEIKEKNTSSTPIEAHVNSPVNCADWCCGWCTETYTKSDGTTGTRTVCCKRCEHTNEYISNGRTSGPATATATVRVPYNFEITNEKIEIGSANKVVYAGETVSISNASFKVNTRTNNTTGKEKGTRYATKAPLKTRIIAYTTNNKNTVNPQTSSASTGDCNSISGKDKCSVIATEEKTYNDPEDTKGKNETEFNNKVYNVFDVPAGTYYCVVVAIYPANSGDDTQMKTSGNNKWKISAPDCRTVAKRPSLQIWGANLYSSGKIEADPAIKRVVDDIHTFEDGKSGGQANSTKNQTVFGSWVEYSITSVGKNAGLTTGGAGGIASGAATGAAGNAQHYGSTFSPDSRLGGSREGDSAISSCNHRSPLTIPNSPCNNNDADIDNPGTASPTDKSSLLSNFTNNNETGDYTYLAKYTTMSDFINGDEQKGNAEIEVGKTYVLEAKGSNDKFANFVIDRDITYETTTYSTTAEIPKLIIHAENIYINCSVARIDAVLIAENTVNTCADSPDVNDSARSNQLKINGTIIANKLEANRTYGAATGIYSVIPAEIIDYDSSLYLWGSPRANTDTSGKTTVTYQTELAPRL